MFKTIFKLRSVGRGALLSPYLVVHNFYHYVATAIRSVLCRLFKFFSALVIVCVTNDLFTMLLDYEFGNFSLVSLRE